MKKLIVVALLGSMLVGCGNNTENQQNNTSQTYEYSSEQLDSSESDSSETTETNNDSSEISDNTSESSNDSLESHSNGLELVYNTIGKPISEFSDYIDMEEFFSKRVSDSTPMVSPFDDSGITMPFNDTYYYYFGIQSDKSSWEEPSNFTLDYIYVDTYDIKNYLDIDIVVNTDGSNMNEVKESFAELWGSPLGTIEFRWEGDYADVYKYNDIYIVAVYGSDGIEDNYSDLVFSSEHYIRCTATETQLSKIGLEPLSLEPSYTNASDLESITLQYMDAVFSVDTSKVELDSELLIASDGTTVADKYTSCSVTSDAGNRFRFELNCIDDYSMELLEYTSKEYDNYKYYTSESEYDAYIETDNLTIRVSNELTEEERSELVDTINKEFVLVK